MKILISGGSGLIGKNLAENLKLRGHEVAVLSRNKNSSWFIKQFRWDYTRHFIEEGALEGVECLIHLAGAGIADKHWTKARKNELIESRVESLRFLSEHVKPSLKILIGGSAIGYYGGDTAENEMDISSKNGSGFLAECTQVWEAEEEKFANKHNLRLCKIRTGVVLSLKGGAFPQLLNPVKWGIGSALGSGRQWISWIHETDLVQIFVDSVENANGPALINAVAPEPIRQRDLSKSIAKVLNKPFFFPAVPAWLLKILLGEMSVVVLGSSKVKTNLNSKSFKFPNLEKALGGLLG
jgi:uncharacterized protein